MAETMYTFSATTPFPALVARLGEVVAEFGTRHGVTGGEAQQPAPPAAKNGTDTTLISQTVDALTYQPLHQTQILALTIWYEAADWVHVGLLQERVLAAGLAKDAAEATARVRGLLAAFANRMVRRVTVGNRRKLEALVDIRYENGGASHRLTASSREAVRQALKL